MKNIITVTLVILFWGCNFKKEQVVSEVQGGIQTIETEDYLLKKTKSNPLATLILFGGFPESPIDIMREFAIDSLAELNGVTLLYSKFNRRLWLEENEKNKLKSTLEHAFEKHILSKENIYIGGFSSGGNISLLLSNYLIEQQSSIQPQGLFLVDSPVDLLALYQCAQKNVKRNFMPASVQESQGIITQFDEHFGNIENGIRNYEKHSPYTCRTKNINNLTDLRNLKIRMYTEPDTLWWKENRRNNYDEMNAFYIKALANEIQDQLNNTKVELIETQNKGFRRNGYRHPHSWSIVDKDELIKWILN